MPDGPLCHLLLGARTRYNSLRAASSVILVGYTQRAKAAWIE
jgi:hypothetical protein